MVVLVEYFDKRLKLRMNGITPLHVLNFIRWRFDGGHRPYPDRPVKPRTVAAEVELLRHMWNCAKGERLAAGENPVLDKDIPKRGSLEITILAEEDFQALLTACQEDDKHRRGGTAPVSDIVLFLRYTGCRVGEALKLHVNDVNHLLGTFTFKNTKNHENRTLPLIPHLAEILDRQAPVDGRYFGGYGQRNRVRQAWERIRERAGFADYRLHDLRHLASTLMQWRADPFSCEKVLGHKIPGMRGHYGHAVWEGLTTALQKLAEPLPSGIRHDTQMTHGESSGG